MVIDIVNYTATQLKGMKPAQVQKILSAQLKKNALLRKCSEDILEAKQRLITRGVFSSTLFDAKAAELTAACDVAVLELREALLFSLGNIQESGGTGGDNSGNTGGNTGENTGGDDTSGVPPYPVDYALSEEDRMLAVKEYYETTYSDAVERFTVFSNDTFAREYLGEMYAPLYHYFEDFTL